MASVSCASAEMEPYDIAPVEKRPTMAETGSTSSIGTGRRTPSAKANSPRRLPDWAASASTAAV